MSVHLESDFYTMKGYGLLDGQKLSPAMEDYLEMISRCTEAVGYVRVNELAARLNVTPPSASKMAAKLRVQGFIQFEHYGIITLTAKGREAGEYLLHRHEVLQAFFCLVNHSEDELKQVEQIEHFLAPGTVRNMEELLPALRDIRSQAAPKSRLNLSLAECGEPRTAGSELG